MADQVAQQICNTSIDFSTITGDRIIPFVFTLNISESNLNPDPGENQRFCYDILGVGTDDPIFADLSHFVFGICPQIPASQITNITVDDVPQELDGNVELFVPPDTDPPTGCSGLKFDFGLSKLGGEMTVCYELTQTYPVGPNPVCVFGGGVPASGLSICGPVCQESETCEAVGYQPATVCVPVTVTPFVIKGTPVTHCCGTPDIMPGLHECPGEVNGSCTFTISQDICVKVPVVFGANTTVGTPSVVCGDATDTDICTNCGEDDGGAAAAAAGTCSTCKSN